MKRKVLIPFDYAFDGVRVNRLRAGKVYEIRDEHVAQFVADGKIEPAAGDPAPKRRRKPKAE